MIFEQLAFSAGLSAESGNREFLHYPPVLDVIVELLDNETNFQTLKNDLEASDSGLQNESLNLLWTVIDRILEREQKEKLLPIVESRFAERANQLRWAGWESLYTSSEQCKRLLGRVLNASVPYTPDMLPNDFRDEYEEIVMESLPTHPFVQGVDRFANSVFRSYLFARALRGDFDEDLRLRTADVLMAPENLQARTRLLAEFYLSSESPEPADFQRIVPEHLGILYDSLLSSETNRRYLRLTIDGPDPSDLEDTGFEDLVEGEFEFLTFDSEGELLADPYTIPFVMNITQSSRVSFTRWIRDCNITLPCSIEFGTSTSREFEIGSGVYVNCKHLSIRSEALKVGGRSRRTSEDEDDSSIILEANFCEYPPAMNRPTVYDPDHFFVSWHGADIFPWTEYSTERRRDSVDDDESLHMAYMRFKRIATAFRSRGKGTLARTSRKIEHQRVLKGDLGMELLRQLVSDGVLLKQGGLYQWNSERADALLGVSWQDLRKGEWTPSLRDYLTSFIQNNTRLFPN